MENDYLVTVAIALYNGEKYIERCINSVLRQTYKNIEIIVIDDGSTDNGVKIIKEITDKVRIYHKENGGLGSARNYSFEKARGEFVLCIDVDDWLEENAVEELVKAQKKYNSDIVKMNYYINKTINKNYYKGNLGKYANKLIEVEKNRENIVYDIILGNITSYTWSMFIRKSKVKEEYYFEKIHLEDKIFLLRFISNIDKIYFLDECLYHYFFNENGLMHKYSYEHYMMQNIEVNKKIREIIEKYYDKNKKLLGANDTLTSYGTERNLFNIYRTTNKENTIKQYENIKEQWKEIQKNSNYEYLKGTVFEDRNIKAINLWNLGEYEKVFKIYDKEKIKYNIKNYLRKIKSFIK